MSKAPACPACGRPMTLVAAVSRLAGAPERHSYACKSCEVEFIELDSGDASLPERVCVLNFEACHESMRQ